MTTIISGTAFASVVKQEVASRIKEVTTTPKLATILIGEDPASETYVKLKEKDCKEVGIDFETHRLPSNTSEKEARELVERLNRDATINGILIQLPLPKHLKDTLLDKMDSAKDVDGLTSANVGKLWSDRYDLDKDLVPCTPRGIMELLDYFNIPISGKNVAIINRSNLVGKPLAKLLLDRDATVTICHSKTTNLDEHTKLADILITAVGHYPKFMLTNEMIKEGAVVIDVGMSYIDGKLHGDVVFVGSKASFITPVPGGVGLATRAMLLKNILIASASDKKQIRAKYKAARSSMSKEDVMLKSSRIKQLLFSLPEFQTAKTVCFYIATKNEVQTENVIRDAIKLGKRVLVPIVEMDRTLVMSRLFDYDKELEPGAFGILEPKSTCRRIVPISEAELIIVPGVVFDLDGNRLGYGGGYYDRFLSSAKTNTRFVGLAYECQVVDKLPHGLGDVPVHKIVTECRVINAIEHLVRDS